MLHKPLYEILMTCNQAESGYVIDVSTDRSLFLLSPFPVIHHESCFVARSCCC